MTAQSYPHRVITIAISIVSIVLAAVLLLLLLVILWRSKPPSFNEKVVCFRGNASRPTDGLADDHAGDAPFVKKTETRKRLDRNDSARHVEQSRSKSLLLTKGNDGNKTTTINSGVVEHDLQPNKGDFIWGAWKNDILPNTKGDLEYIRPQKLSRNQFEEPIDDERLSAKRHHSGHFRHSSARVWDPHPQYEFTAFGRKFLLRLFHDSSFIFANITVTHMRANMTKFETPNQHLDCLYTGTVDGDPNSVVSVSLCHGMTGHMRTSTGSYFIKPAEQWYNNKSSPVGSSLQHAILRVQEYTGLQTDINHQPTPNDITPKSHECAVIDDGIAMENVPLVQQLTNDFDETYNSSKNQSRRRRRRHVKRIIDIVDSEQGDGAFLVHDENTGYTSEETDMNNYISKDDQFLPKNDNSSDKTSNNILNASSDIYDNWRRRRAIPSREYFIEIMVVADAKMVDYHSRGLFGYILVLMSTVARIYKDPSIGNPISISLVKIVTTDEIFVPRNSNSEGISASEMLKKFCHWQKRNNPHEPSPEHHDVALLLTRENLCHNPGEKLCDTLGLAELGRMCSPGSSCAIVQDNGLAAAFTIAHEIGHVLNMPHDDDSKCSGFRNRSGVHYIMSRMLDDHTFPWEWSKCSRHALTEYLDAGYGNCLLDEPSTMMTSLYNRLPGEDYSENRQCELSFGPGSKVCPHMTVCKKLWCTVPYWDRSQQCHTQHMPLADGTSCGEGKWCHRGECVSRKNLQPIDGQWSEWGRYSECSRTCGGGIKKKVRDCNNPPPKNGGNYCVGERIKYRSCGTKECPPGSIDFREEQCAKFNNDNQNIHNLARDVKWRAKYTRILPEDRCKLYCEVDSNQYYMLRNKVIDGTTCGPDTFHMCVNGRCKPAGCDHVLNSTAELDTCGVCRGNNSTCERITGTYNSSEYGYQRVTKIPAGSSYIDIKQHSWSTMANDSNYLALRIGENGKYILNGNFMVMHRQVIVLPGLTMEYSGAEPVVERLNSSRPISVDLVVEVLSVGNVLPPQITYEYTVPKSILYGFKWVLSEWSDCSRLCQGTKTRKAICRGFENNDIVSDDYCRNSDKPQEEIRSCNQHCTLQWQVLSVSECSSHCGPGIRTVTYRCVQIISFSKIQRPVPSHVCSHLKHDSEQQRCTGSCKDAHWRYGDWSACSVTCGGGVQMRSAACVIDLNQEIVPDDKCSSEEKIVKRICGQETCPKWDFGNWAPCSVTCGTGWREREYWCQIDNHVVPMSNCKGSPPLLKEVCDAGPCYQWETSAWSTCSVTCGEGVRRRTIECKNVGSSVSSDKCDSSTRPINVTKCTLNPCHLITTIVPTVYSSKSISNGSSKRNSDIDNNNINTYKYEWHIVNYGKCSKPCGGGIANRLIKCVSTDTKMAFPNHFCDTNLRPPDTISCNKHPCPKWDTGDWSQCNVKCGEGYQGRQVRCRNWRGQVLRDNECLLKQKPRSTRKCQRHHCNILRHFKWKTSSWSNCSATCGKGVQSRNVTCHRVNPYGWIDPVPTEGCTILDKPITQQTCKLRDCRDSFYWSTGNWRKCSYPCGRNGKQTRRLFCHDRTGKKVPRHNCSKDTKPQRKRKCNQRKCGFISCLEIKKRSGSSADGEYELLVGGKNMSIYCHEMSGNDPKEYLTLLAGDQKNYAEIYGKRLLNPQTCPFNGKRNDSCVCVSDEGTISGKTMFKRIRLDVSKLLVIVDDYTFSWTEGTRRIEYGKAGDCYSLKNCPQGSFSIDLRGTLLKVSSEVTWTTQKMKAYHFINRISDQLIIGKCGGYCGFCTPSSGIKLDVLPP